MIYTHIFFDADGTLFDYDRAEEYALGNVLNGYGISMSGHIIDVYGEINNALWDRFESGLITIGELQVRRFEELFAAIGADGMNATEVSAEYLEWLGRGDFLNEGALEICRAHHSNAEISIVTNGISTTQRSRVAASAISDYIANLFVSEDIGHSKPDKRFFSHVLDKVRMGEGGKALVVGDSLNADIQGGINAGLDTCWYNPSGLDNDTLFEPKYSISHFSELEGIIGLQRQP